MSERTHLFFLKDILDSAEKVITLTGALQKDVFFSDWIIVDAVIRNLEIIGEAAKRIPDAVKQRYTDIEWRKIAGFRDVMIHDYFKINKDILWDVVRNKIPELPERIKTIIADNKLT